MNASHLRNVAMVVEYDGTDYHGFQYQPRHRSVQGELEKAIGRITGEQIRIHGAGRTDAGVHATGQVINARLASALTVTDLVRALNAVLPSDVAVRNPREMPADFDARHSARARTYRYTVWTGAVRGPTLARYTHHWAGGLDIAAVDEALRSLIGTHDLAAFSGPLARETRVRSGVEPATVRKVEAIDCRRRRNLVTVEITASGFLPHMVRNVMGAVLWVGSGRMARDGIVKLMESRDFCASRRVQIPVPPTRGKD